MNAAQKHRGPDDEGYLLVDSPGQRTLECGGKDTVPSLALPPIERFHGETFDMVLAMEVVEHVADVQAFVTACARTVKPGGLLVMATINRTLRSFALAIVGAEYVLGWLPRGTHQWNRFVTPEELAQAVGAAGLSVIDETGVVYNPLRDLWSLSGDRAVNYMIAAERA